MITIDPQPIIASALLEQFEKTAVGAGAIVSFSGHVRAQAKDSAVQTLSLQAYSPMTDRGIEHAVAEAQSRWPISDVRVAHRIGDMKPGDTIVFVAAASAHRRAAFEAADFLMDYLKTKAVFWKQECTDAGTVWIEPRGEDYEDAARWDDATD